MSNEPKTLYHWELVKAGPATRLVGVAENLNDPGFLDEEPTISHIIVGFNETSGAFIDRMGQPYLLDVVTPQCGNVTHRQNRIDELAAAAASGKFNEIARERNEAEKAKGTPLAATAALLGGGNEEENALEKARQAILPSNETSGNKVLIASLG